MTGMPARLRGTGAQGQRRLQPDGAAPGTVTGQSRTRRASPTRHQRTRLQHGNSMLTRPTGDPVATPRLPQACVARASSCSLVVVLVFGKVFCGLLLVLVLLILHAILLLLLIHLGGSRRLSAGTSTARRAR